MSILAAVLHRYSAIVGHKAIIMCVFGNGQYGPRTPDCATQFCARVVATSCSYVRAVVFNCCAYQYVCIAACYHCPHVALHQMSVDSGRHRNGSRKLCCNPLLHIRRGLAYHSFRCIRTGLRFLLCLRRCVRVAAARTSPKTPRPSGCASAPAAHSCTAARSLLERQTS